MSVLRLWGTGLALALAIAPVSPGQEPRGPEEHRVPLTPAMVRTASERADFSGLADEQDLRAGPPKRGWDIPSQFWKDFPYRATIDLGQVRDLSGLWFYDTNGIGSFRIHAGEPGRMKVAATAKTDLYQQWSLLGLDVSTRYLEIELVDPGANLGEIVLYEYTPEGQRAMLAARQEAEQRASAKAEALARSRAEMASRPVVDLPPFGRVRLVDEVDLGAADPGHRFQESPRGISRVETILGRPCRVLEPRDGEGSFLAVRLGEWKGLRPGAGYVVVLDYPEDRPRSVFVRNGGNEASLGFHTGTTVGDALHAKYVNGNPESLKLPLSGRYETWTLYFNLHDRSPLLGFPRDPEPRTLPAEDGFTFAIAQLPSRDDPTSAGAAAARVRLYEVLDQKALEQPLHYPPAPLPRRHVFWREEMADGVIASDRESERGVDDRLDWYRFKANQMALLGIGTFGKDLLEFGACQHWDPTPYGGNAWVHHADGSRGLWAEIVALMGQRGRSLLPYYEYAGSKGDKGLGYERRAKPLTRDDAFTHISWIETANADLTDPDTLADFAKMLDLTVLRLKDQAHFDGVWLRPRSQWPLGFGDGALGRFAKETNAGRSITRADLRADAALLRRYEAWWYGKRRTFLEGVRDHLRRGGLPDALVVFTPDPGEPGPPFPTWEKRLVTDDVPAWSTILKDPRHVIDGKPTVPIGVDRVLREGLYLEALTAAPLSWGGWEVDHASPPADPERYGDVPGVLLSHGIHRSYSAASARTFDAFRGPSGLAVVRHRPLNEHMLFDRADKPLLGYFVADVERAGPACMLTEALAVANGDPTELGYLLGGPIGRGFPQYVRSFHANFLALPALPSERLDGACDDPEVVVRAIRTEGHGTYLAVVNTGATAKAAVAIRLPQAGRVVEAATERVLETVVGTVTLRLEAFELRSLHVE